jgi:hypothetical protein
MSTAERSSSFVPVPDPGTKIITGYGPAVAGTSRIAENNRRARFYDLTTEGRKHLASERAAWQRSSRAVNWTLDWAEAP